MTIGGFEAKTNLSALLDRVAKGERITITGHGIAATMLVPIGGSAEKLTHKEIVESMRALRLRVKPGELSVREMIGEDRRF